MTQSKRRNKGRDNNFRAAFRRNISRKMLVVVLVLVLVAVGFLTYRVSDLDQTSSSLRQQVSVFTGEGRIFTFNGDTFVKYDTPPLSVTIFTTECETCEEDTRALLTHLQAQLPTLADVRVLDIATDEGQRESETLGLTYVPAAVFDNAVTSTDFYTSGERFFHKQEAGHYILYPHVLGVSPAEYLAKPDTAQAITKSVENRDITITAFLTTDCAACKTMYDVLDIIAARNPQTVDVATILSEENQLTEHSATTATFCANELDKGDAYLKQLYARQTAWVAVEDKALAFANYARTVGLDAEAFASCVGQEHSSEAVHEKLFDTFGITQLPTIFIGDEVLTGVQTVATIDAKVKAILNPPTETSVTATGTQLVQ